VTSPRDSNRTALCAASLTAHCLDIQISDIQRVVFDEFAARFDLVAHQDGEDLISLDGIVDADLLPD
jgi:uncharacterized protein YlaN (UPF0358 family)